MTLYVVTGRHRTGTSMMMRALSTSSTSLVPHVDMEMEYLIRSREASPDYDPNPNGYYQSNLTDLTELADDTLVKVTMRLWESSKLRVPDDMMILHMTRNEADRVMSFERGFGVRESSTRHYEAGEQALDGFLNVAVLDYDDVVADPLEAFEVLADVFSWPIEPVLAAALVDPSLHRNKG